MKTWFSAALVFKSAVTCEAADDEYWRSVVVFRATSWQEARARSAQIGRTAQESYVNADGAPVERLFLGVDTLDQLDSRMLDGREVYAERILADEAQTAHATWEQDGPQQTGV